MVQRAWETVRSRWDDDKAHQAFVTLSASTGRLAEAGRRYRDVREHEPERAARAEAQIDRILGLAMQNLAALKTERSPQSAKTRMALVSFGIALAFTGAALFALLRLL